jgi:ligand-binding sensor domain-containing protein
MTTSKVSTNKQTKIKDLAQQHQNALDSIFTLVRMIMDLKDDVINQIESGEKGEIWDTEGEGRVRYGGPDKQFGNVKLVPRKRWTPT